MNHQKQKDKPRFSTAPRRSIKELVALLAEDLVTPTHTSFKAVKDTTCRRTFVNGGRSVMGEHDPELRREVRRRILYGC